MQLFLAYWERETQQSGTYSVLKPNTKEVTVEIMYKADITNFVTMIKPTEISPNIWSGSTVVGTLFKLVYLFSPDSMGYPQVTLSFTDGRDITSFGQIQNLCMISRR